MSFSEFSWKMVGLRSWFLIDPCAFLIDLMCVFSVEHLWKNEYFWVFLESGGSPKASQTVDRNRRGFRWMDRCSWLL